MTDQGATGPGCILTNLPPDAVVRTLDELARRGKLPGFVAGSGGSPWLFQADAFAAPFDGRLRATAAPEPDGRTRLHTAVSVKPLWPWCFAVAMILAVWPGVVLTESLLASFFPHTPWTWQYTWWWYMPLSVPSAPWAIWHALSRSRTAARQSAAELVANLARALDGVVEG